jgi:hypothetical protein
VTRKSIMTLAILAGLSAMAACGSSSGTSAPSSSSSTAVTVNPTADRATATTINLTSADRPGWSSSPNTTSSGDQATSAQLAACAGASNPNAVDVVDVSSPDFNQNQAGESSDVTMVKTHADGLSDLRALKGPKLDPCLQQIGVPELKAALGPGESLSDVQITTINPPGAPPDSFALRLTVGITVPQQGTANLTVDVVGFLVGRAEITLSSSNVGQNPDPTLEQQLLSLLVTRANSASQEAA